MNFENEEKVFNEYLEEMADYEEFPVLDEFIKELKKHKKNILAK
jgi:hypothetical protein